MHRLSAVSLAVLLGLLAWVATAHAQDAAAPAPAAPASPSLMLQLLNRQSEPVEISLKESLRPDLAPPPAPRADVPERLSDGSVRYGRTRVNVKVNGDCPDDPFHEAPPPPPLRRAR
jgi:hypothetical protein